MKPTTTIADPMVSRRGRVYSLKGLRQLMAAIAAMEKNEKNSPSPLRRVDKRCNAGKRALSALSNPHREKRNHEQI